jgi:hypothetical protein
MHLLFFRFFLFLIFNFYYNSQFYRRWNSRWIGHDGREKSGEIRGRFRRRIRERDFIARGGWEEREEHPSTAGGGTILGYIHYAFSNTFSFVSGLRLARVSLESFADNAHNRRDFR